LKRFKFRLEPVLRVREVREHQARAALVAANRAVDAAGGVLTDRVRAYDGAPRATGAVPAARFTRDVERLERAAGAIFVARERLQDAVDEADGRRAEWSEARQEVRALERLEARAREAHAREVLRAEDRLVDDLVTARHDRGGDIPGGGIR
jgi:flagellar biosynthesis chaperone FliJ